MQQRGPWKVKGGAVVYTNPWLELREDKVIGPDGKDSVFGVVSLSRGVSVLALDGDGFVYLVEEYKYALGRNSLETVSGAIDEGEDSLGAAKRELKEEAGIVAGEWHSFGWLDPLSSTVSCPQHLYLAQGLEFGESNLEANERIEVRRIRFEEAVRMVLENKITYGPGCVLILKAHEYLKRAV